MDGLGDLIELTLNLFELLCLTVRLTCSLVRWTAGLFRGPRDGGYLTIESNHRPAASQGFRSITYSRRKPRLSRYVVR
jgi:hypothetical protein